MKLIPLDQPALQDLIAQVDQHRYRRFGRQGIPAFVAWVTQLGDQPVTLVALEHEGRYHGLVVASGRVSEAKSAAEVWLRSSEPVAPEVDRLAIEAMRQVWG